MPKFSIIVPVYNVESYIDECVKSIISQSFADWELVLVDDGSQDKCPAICDAYAVQDSRIKVVHKENGGLSSARNTGLDNATGEYLLFLDSDDFYNVDNAFELLSDKIAGSNADVVIFGCTDWNMNTDKTVISRSGYNLELIDKMELNNTLHYLFAEKMLPGGATVFTVKRELIENRNIRFKTGIQNEDHDFVLGVFTACSSVCAINEPFYTYRLGRDDSITGSPNIKRIYGIEYTINKWLLICDGMENSQLQSDIRNYLAFIYSTGFVIIGSMKKSNRREALAIMKKYKAVLSLGYWKKTKLVKIGVSLMGVNLFSRVSSIYYNLTHIR